MINIIARGKTLSSSLNSLTSTPLGSLVPLNHVQNLFAKKFYVTKNHKCPPNTLFYSPKSCSAASFIAAYIANVNLNTEQVNISSHITQHHTNFFDINPNGYVPTLLLDNGLILTENAAVLQYIADQAPGKIAPENGTIDRYLVQSHLSFIASEVHATIKHVLHTPSQHQTTQDIFREKYTTKLNYIEQYLLDTDYLLSNNITIADFYLFIVLRWSPYAGVNLNEYPKIQAYLNRIQSLPKVKEAQARMELAPKSIFP